jgi:hypothetical protein
LLAGRREKRSNAADSKSRVWPDPGAGETLGKAGKNVKLSIAVENGSKPTYGRGVNAVPLSLGRFCALLTFFAFVVPGCADGQSHAPAVGNSRALLARIGRTYGIQIVAADRVFPVETTYGEIEGRVATADEIERYTALFAREFTLYPASLIKRTQLKRVVLCKDLAFAGQFRRAIPDFEHKTLYLDVLRGGSDPLYLCKVSHHEFFHMIDYRDDGLVYADKHWASLNAPDFKYGTGGKNAQLVADARVLTDKFPGFLNYYSTTGVEEDKAEVFANLIVDTAYVAERSPTDRVLRAKVQALKALMAKFCPDVNEPFWDRAGQTDRSGAN